MKTNKVVKIVAKVGVYLLASISIFIVILQMNPKIEEVKLADKVANKQEEKIEDRTKEQVTSRHSIIRNKKIENLNQEEVIQETIEPQYAKIEDIIIFKDMDLTVRTGISKEDFRQLISNVKYDTSKFFYDNSEMIYDLCEQYQINEIFFCGLISAESGWNIANNHRRTHNYISLMTKNGLIHYNSVEEGLTAAAKALHNNYLTEGGRFYHGKTLYGVKTKFCPASSTWIDLVYGRMSQIMNCI